MRVRGYLFLFFEVGSQEVRNWQISLFVFCGLNESRITDYEYVRELKLPLS